MQLRPYQQDGIQELAQKAIRKRKLVFQLATGGGKTVAFSAVTNRFLNKQETRVVILVHREELLKQACKTLYRGFDIIGIPITANHKYFPNAKVYVAMVETAHNRLKKNRNYFGNVGLVIVDECHIGNFKKLYDYFPESIIIGFTATPLASSAKDPLKNYFDDIVCCVSIPELIQEWKKDPTTGLVPNITYDVKSVKRSSLSIKNGEFDEVVMARMYSSDKNVHNAIKSYQQYCKGKKTLIFNVNIEHSKKVRDAFAAYGYNCRHIDGETDPRERVATLQWFSETPDAILCNVGVLTTGFDEPSIEAIVVNRSTTSIPLWLQMCGRGSRPYPGKQSFTIVDLGENAIAHGDWSHPHDWRAIFHNPPEVKADGEAPVKSCQGCHRLIHLSCITCPNCGFENRRIQRYDNFKLETSRFAGRKNVEIYVDKLVNDIKGKLTQKGQPYSKFYVLNQIKLMIVRHAKYNWRLNSLDDVTAQQMLNYYLLNCEEWARITEQKWKGWLQRTATEWFMEELKRTFKYEPSTNKSTSDPVHATSQIDEFDNMNPFA
ncbi:MULTISPECIES: DEAD/DEAH box helicase [unclassified Paraflavitalea]|uniref:DEAD/DEAH box helicase n=1 Tax=unclassified Paraflavitalea TaxID=2798305 RepID=UPI003D330C77